MHCWPSNPLLSSRRKQCGPEHTAGSPEELLLLLLTVKHSMCLLTCTETAFSLRLRLLHDNIMPIKSLSSRKYLMLLKFDFVAPEQKVYSWRFEWPYNRLTVAFSKGSSDLNLVFYCHFLFIFLFHFCRWCCLSLNSCQTVMEAPKETSLVLHDHRIYCVFTLRSSLFLERWPLPSQALQKSVSPQAVPLIYIITKSNNVSYTHQPH